MRGWKRKQIQLTEERWQGVMVGMSGTGNNFYLSFLPFATPVRLKFSLLVRWGGFFFFHCVVWCCTNTVRLLVALAFLVTGCDLPIILQVTISTARYRQYKQCTWPLSPLVGRGDKQEEKRKKKERERKSISLLPGSNNILEKQSTVSYSAGKHEEGVYYGPPKSKQLSSQLVPIIRKLCMESYSLQPRASVAGNNTAMLPSPGIRTLGFLSNAAIQKW